MSGYYLIYHCCGDYGYTSAEAPHFNPTEKAVLFATKKDARKALRPILRGMTRFAARRFRIVDSCNADNLKNA